VVSTVSGVVILHDADQSVAVDCRHAMLPVMLTHVDDLMMCRLELELCIKIISDIVDLLFETNRLVCYVFSGVLSSSVSISLCR